MVDKVYFKHSKFMGMGSFSLASIKNGYEIRSPPVYDLNEKEKEIMRKLGNQHGVEAYISEEASSGNFIKKLVGDKKGHEWFDAFKNILSAAARLTKEINKTVVLSLRIDPNLKNKILDTKDYVNIVTELLEKKFGN